jgi:hypothetical protein
MTAFSLQQEFASKNAFQASCTKQNQNIRRTIHWNLLCDVAIIIYNNAKPKHQKLKPPESLVLVTIIIYNQVKRITLKMISGCDPSCGGTIAKALAVVHLEYQRLQNMMII